MMLFLLLLSLNALSTYIQLFIYFTFSIIMLLVFCVPVTCNYTAQTIVHTKNHRASYTCYYLSAVQNVGYIKFYEFFFYLYNLCWVWSIVTLVYRNLWVAIKMIYCIWLCQRHLSIGIRKMSWIYSFLYNRLNVRTLDVIEIKKTSLLYFMMIFFAVLQCLKQWPVNGHWPL